MKNTKKIISIVISVIMLIGCCSAGFSGMAAGTVVQQGKCGDNISWVITSDRVMTLSGTGDMPNYSAYSRPTYERYMYRVDTLVIEEGITRIGNYAFYRPKAGGSDPVDRLVYTYLKGAITIPDSVTAIGSNAFAYCPNITSLNLGTENSNLTTIGSYAFCECSALTGDLDIPNKVETIDTYAFSTCSGFNGRLVLSDHLKTIGQNTFYKCSGFIGNLTIPDSVELIGQCAFLGCTGFNGELTLGNSIQTIKANAFSDCFNLTGKLVIPESATNIHASAFNRAAAYTNYSNIYQGYLADANAIIFYEDYPEYISIIHEEGSNEYNIISSSSRNTTVTSSNLMCTVIEPLENTSVESITPDPASMDLDIGSSQQISVSVLPLAATDITVSYESEDPDIATVSEEGLVTAVSEGETTITITANDGSGVTASVAVNSICHYVESVTVTPISIAMNPTETIQLETEVFPDIATYPELTYTVADPSVASVSETGLITANAVGSTTVTISATDGTDISVIVSVLVTDVLYFGQCGDTAYWYIDNNETLHIYGIGEMWDFTTGENNRASYDNYIDYFNSVVFEEGITYIGKYSFYWGYWDETTQTIPNHYTNLTGSLVFPDSLIKIGYSAFRRCSGLNGTLTFGNSLNKIEGYAFAECSNLTGSLVFPDSLESIDSNVFDGCSGFNGTLEFNEGLKQIGDIVFWGCNNLTGQLIIPDSVTHIGVSAFVGCRGFSSLKLSENLVYIGDTAFSGCNFGGTLVIPDSMHYIGILAFKNCKNFTGLDLGTGVTTLKFGAFMGCSGLTGKLVIPASVTTIEDCVFHGCAADTDIETFFEDYPEYIEIVETGRTEPTEYSNGVIQYNVYCTCNDHKKANPFSDKLITSIERVVPYVYADVLAPENVPDVITAGEAYQLNIVITPADATSHELIYSSSDDSVATVTDAGVVNGVAEGRAVITASTADGSDRSVDVPVYIHDSNNLFRGQCGDDVWWFIDPDGELVIYGVGDMWDFTATYRPSYEPYVAEFSQLVVREGVTSIGDYAFYRETYQDDERSVQELQYLNLTGYLILPESIQDVGTDAFRNCKNLTGEYVTIDEDPVEQPENTEISDGDAISGIIQRLIALIMKIVAMIKSLVGQNQ